MRPIDSCYDRGCYNAGADSIIARLEAGELIEYEEMEDLDDMARDNICRFVELVEVPGYGYESES